MSQKDSISKKKRLMNLLIGLLVSLLIILASYTKFYEITEYKLYDQRFLLRGSIKMDPKIVTIDIDGATLAEEGRFQDWTRDKHADLVKALHNMKASMIGFDIYFPERSERVLNLKELKQMDIYKKNESIPTNAVESLFPDHDQYLADIMKKTNITILGQSFKSGEKQDTSYIKHNTILPKGSSYEAYKTLEKYSIDYPQWTESSILRYVEIEPPIKKLIEASRGVAFAMTVADIDGSVRRYPLIICYDGKLFPALSLLMFCDYIGVDIKDIKIKPGDYVDIPEGTLPSGEKVKVKIPIDEKGRMLVNWAGSWNEDDFLHIPYIAAVKFSKLIQQETILRKIKKIYHEDKETLENTDLFVQKYREQGGEINELVQLVYSGLYNAVKLEEFIKEGVEFTEEDLPPDVWSMYEPMKYNYKMVDTLKFNPDLTLNEISKIIEEPRLRKIRSSYYILTDILRERELKEEDYPLYFLSPDIGGKILYPEDFRDKVFFYGLTAAGTWDLNPMPYMDRYPMLGLHANAFNTILQADFIKQLTHFENIIIMLILGILIGLIVPVFRPITGAVIMAIFSVGYLVLAQYLFQSHGLWIDLLGPVAILIFGYTSATVYNFFSEEQEKKMIRGIFSRYVTKSVVDELIKNPEMVKLGGEKKELTVFFSDVAGFTTISEQLTPEELVALLNEYLTAMTHIVLRYDGMIDKYEGDAIMAVFGAPIFYADHATRACYVSLDMQKELIGLRKKWKQEGKPELYVRIGLNTGPMVIGNMGAMDRLDYTVMGDSVNLGARLEGANKQYGTYIMISEFTYEKCKDDVEVRFLDMLRVKGKHLPVTVYEVLSRKSDGLAEKDKKVIEAYSQGIKYYKNMEWDKGIQSFEDALSLNHEDGPSKVYLERCKQYKINPPPDDWDGVFVMTTK